MDRKQTPPSQLHYHIHWSGKEALDWERFDSGLEAEASATQLVRVGETYTIEEHDETCPRCRASFKLKTDHAMPPPVFEYPWQQAVYDAFAEKRSELVSWKINMAQRAISARLYDKTPLVQAEHIAIREALQSLSALVAETKKESGQGNDSGDKKATA